MLCLFNDGRECIAKIPADCQCQQIPAWLYKEFFETLQQKLRARLARQKRDEYEL